MITPRDYQQYSLPAWLDYIKSGKMNPLLLYPTGVGKSVILALLIKHCLTTWNGTRAMILTHSKELVAQDYDKFMKYWPMGPAGIYCSGLNQSVYWQAVTIGTIQSVYHQPELFGRIDFLFIDEAHLISLKETSMYRDFIKYHRERNPYLVVTGLTATGFRNKQGYLWQGEGALFDGCAVNACTLEAFNWFLDEGYLVPPVARKLKYEYDTSQVHTKAGEFDAKELDEAVNKKDINEKVVEMMLEVFHEEGRNAGLVFGANIKHVENLYDILKYNNARVTFVHSKMTDSKERDRRIEAYIQGDYQWIVNNGILTTGFDYPALDFIGMATATKSSSRWVQIMGRGTRPYYMDDFDLTTLEGRLASIQASPKQDCRVMDFGRNAERLGPINDPVIPQPPGEKKRPGEAPIAICPICGTYNHASAPVCIACGHIFERRSKIEEMTSGAKLVKERKPAIPPPTINLEPEIIDFDVDHVTYSAHYKKDKPPTLKVVYQCGLRTFDEYVHLEISSPFRGKGANWWIQRTGCAPHEVPQSVNEALSKSDELKQAQVVSVDMTPKYPLIKGCKYEKRT